MIWNKKGDVNWIVVGMILAILVLVIVIVIFREQIGNVVKNFGFLTPNETVVKNVSDCLNNPGAPGCEGAMKFP